MGNPRRIFPGLNSVPNIDALHIGRRAGDLEAVDFAITHSGPPKGGSQIQKTQKNRLGVTYVDFSELGLRPRGRAWKLGHRPRESRAAATLRRRGYARQLGYRLRTPCAFLGIRLRAWARLLLLWPRSLNIRIAFHRRGVSHRCGL